MEPIQVERFYLGCLAHASYMIASEGVAAVIDPQRDVDIYLEAASNKTWRIEQIIETHLHADFVSGHRELAERTGARRYRQLSAGARNALSRNFYGIVVRLEQRLMEIRSDEDAAAKTAHQS